MTYEEIEARLRRGKRAACIEPLRKSIVRAVQLQHGEPVTEELLRQMRGEFSDDITEWYENEEHITPYDALLSIRDQYVVTWAIANVLKDLDKETQQARENATARTVRRGWDPAAAEQAAADTELFGEVARNKLLDLIKWMAQNVHQAYHHDEESARVPWQGCKHGFCSSVVHVLKSEGFEVPE
jgi:hypothetical protein